MVEYKPKYNPADNAEIKSIAEKMHKSELEDYYVKDKNNRYTTWGEGLGIALVVVIMLGLLIGFGMVITHVIISNDVENSMQDISQEVCSYLGVGYTSQEAFHSSYAETRIVCNQANSGWRGK